MIVLALPTDAASCAASCYRLPLSTKAVGCIFWTTGSRSIRCQVRVSQCACEYVAGPSFFLKNVSYEGSRDPALSWHSGGVLVCRPTFGIPESRIEPTVWPLWQHYLRSLQANRADNADQVAPSDCGEPNIGFGSSSVGAEEAES